MRENWINKNKYLSFYINDEYFSLRQDDSTNQELKVIEIIG